MVIDYDVVSYKDQMQDAVRAFPCRAIRYVINLFPIFQWIHRYNSMWLIRDLVAGITVGIVVVPQSMGYAKLAELPAEYGLYTAFVGLCVYCFFGTSKDISIGPTAVMSLLLGQMITQSSSQALDITGPAIASTFSLMLGLSILVLGLVRLGILVELIPGPVIEGFMTGSAITITLSQLKSLTGISEINTQDSAYLIVGQFIQHLSHIQLDLAFGAIGLLWLYGVQYGCTLLKRRYPRYEDAIFMFSIMRNGILVIVGTLVAFLINIRRDESPVQILQTVPAGFQAMGVPSLNPSLVGVVAPSLPSGIVVLILEHLAIAKSFGRLNNYNVRPSQEVVAIGFINIVSSFFGAYPSTGSFSRTAIMSRSGVKTSLSGIVAAAVILLALYVLTPAFYYIPNAILAAVVIHAVANLVSRPSYLLRLYKISLWELGTFVVAVVVTCFTSVEYGIYAALGISTLLLLGRIARPKCEVLGRIPLDHAGFLYISQQHPALGRHAHPMPDGIVAIRVAESMTYPNATFVAEQLIALCKVASMPKQKSKQKDEVEQQEQQQQQQHHLDDHHNVVDHLTTETRCPNSIAKGVLSAVVFDMAGVHRIDSSGAQSLCDAQHALARYTGHPVTFHFAGVLDPSVRHVLVVSGFGDQASSLSIINTNSNNSSGSSNSNSNNCGLKAEKTNQTEDVGLMPLPKDKYPCFHWSLDEAIRVATTTVRDRRREQDDEEQAQIQVVMAGPS
ncbi:sulfate transporter family-domain-containing protein [Dichotomocladium elegans]|nr:sulfate transporter family-domain-containing protein [Dichotomocladium elegans]